MLKPPPDRLYGRVRGHALRARQVWLLDHALPRLRFATEDARDPLASFNGHARALWLEVGAGSGEHAAAMAARHPAVGLIACETYLNGICSLLSRLLPAEAEPSTALPANLRLWPDDARVLIRTLPDGCLSRLFLLFPDPWPKARHAKRRFVHPALLPELARVLRPGGEWRLATDDPTYQGWVDEVMGAQDDFRPAARTDQRPLDWPPTRYEVKARAAGRQPLFWCFNRR